MKKINQKYFTVAVYTFAVLAFSLLFLIFCINFNLITSAIGSFFSAIASILYAILFALLLLPAVKRLERLFARILCRKKQRRGLVSGMAIFTAFLLVFLAILCFALGLIPHLIEDVEQLYSLATKAQSSIEDFVTQNSTVFPFLDDLYHAFRGMLTTGGDGGAPTPIFSPLSAIGAAASQLSNIFLGLIISVYFLASRRVISGIMGKLMIAIFPRRRALSIVRFFKRLYTDFSSFASSRLLCAFLLTVGMLGLCILFRVPLLSLLVITLLISHLIPVIGPILGDTASIVFVFALKPWYVGVIFAVTLLALEVLFARILLPGMLPKKLHPPYALAALTVLIGFFFFGIIGAFIAVPVYATLNVEVRTLLFRRLHKKGLPTHREAYQDFDAATYEKLTKQSAEEANAEKQPANEQAAEAKPTETQPSETQASETQPSETQPSETQASEAQPTEARAPEEKAEDAAPTEDEARGS